MLHPNVCETQLDFESAMWSQFFHAKLFPDHSIHKLFWIKNIGSHIEINVNLNKNKEMLHHDINKTKHNEQAFI